MVETIATEFKNFVSSQEAMISVYVYLEISEVKKYYDVEYKYNNDLKKIVITGKKNKNDSFAAFVPVRVFEKLNYLKLQKFINANTDQIVYIAIVHADSTCVYYQITDGLLEHNDTSSKQLKENKREKLDSELRKYKSIIEEAALQSRLVTISRN
ncbi:tRNA-splicing endonuclease subunit Sen15-like [Diorhabda carinulata]|uniref:tRNA-splicing endonuclease subunit Sen15-like n=1 Tax=Diorhabda carinulata TaxID=1163345 RepID=UPI0025A28153|nr:tRNA-splicing endonuclease subunit Sen15-like [Diorhabda carinulata]